MFKNVYCVKKRNLFFEIVYLSLIPATLKIFCKTNPFISMIRNLLCPIVVILTISVGLNAQDNIFSQFYATPMQLNPALTGTSIAPRFILNYRNEWPNLSNAYVTYSASYDQMIPDINSGFGVNIMSDVAGNGIYKNNSIDLSYAYSFKLDNDFQLKGGLQGGLTQVSYDWNQLIFLDQIDPITGATDPTGVPNPTGEQRPFNTNRVYFDAGGGLLLYNKNVYGGIALKHINAPDESILDGNVSAIVPLRIVAQAGGQIRLRKNHKKYLESPFISPNVLFVRQGEFQQINAGAYASYSKVYGGLWFRHSKSNADAVIILVGFQHHVFKIGYSYDATISQLAGVSGGAHEIGITINFDNDPTISRRQRAKRYTDCLQMFR